MSINAIRKLFGLALTEQPQQFAGVQRNRWQGKCTVWKRDATTKRMKIARHEIYPQPRLLWDSSKRGTYVRAKHGELG